MLKLDMALPRSHAPNARRAARSGPNASKFHQVFGNEHPTEKMFLRLAYEACVLVLGITSGRQVSENHRFHARPFCHSTDFLGCEVFFHHVM